MQAIQILKDEHRVIEQVLECLEKMVERCESEGTIDARSARDAVSFFRVYADRCHHGKEEKELFPMMETRGFSPDHGPTAVMRSEHVRGRELVGKIDASIDPASEGDLESLRQFRDCSREFITLLREHIQKEDQCLFPMAEQTLTASEQQELLRRFDDVEETLVGEGLHDTCCRVADALADRFGVARHGAKIGWS